MYDDPKLEHLVKVTRALIDADEIISKYYGPNTKVRTELKILIEENKSELNELFRTNL